jgi:hypothetical protein
MWRESAKSGAACRKRWGVAPHFTQYFVSTVDVDDAHVAGVRRKWGSVPQKVRRSAPLYPVFYLDGRRG